MTELNVINTWSLGPITHRMNLRDLDLVSTSSGTVLYATNGPIWRRYRGLILHRRSHHEWMDDQNSGFSVIAYIGGDNDASPIRVSDSRSLMETTRADDPAVKKVIESLILATLASEEDYAFVNGSKANILENAANGLRLASTQIIQLESNIGYVESELQSAKVSVSSEIATTEQIRAETLGIDEFEVASKLQAAELQLEKNLCCHSKIIANELIRVSPMIRLWTAFLMIMMASTPSFADRIRIKDLVSFDGVRGNDLVGYGLVVGLNGTGDGIRNAPFTEEIMSNILERLGVNITGEQFRPKNVAAVFVTAELPPFSRAGASIDITVSAIGDAKSLLGGTLVMTPLNAADGQIYAVAQGTIIAGGVAAEGDGAAVIQGVPTSGSIPSGARVERGAMTESGVWAV